MIKVIITENLYKDITKKFNTSEANNIFDLLKSLEDNPSKGKEISCVGKMLIKELKYDKFRFYFITDGYTIKILKTTELKDLIFKFIRMSEKKNQQQTIEEIKVVLRLLGEEGF